MIRSFRDLEVWKKAMDLTVEVYRATADFPKDERFALTSQLHRAVVSVPSNIAEGQGRGSQADFLRFLYIARGSLFEVSTQVAIAHRLSFISDERADQIQNCADEVGRILSGLIRSLS